MPCSWSSSRTRLRAAGTGSLVKSFRAWRSFASSASLSCGQDSTAHFSSRSPLLGLALFEQCYEAGIPSWGLGETIPGSLPRRLGMSPQPLGTIEFTVLQRVEPVLRLSPAAKGLPPARFPPLSTSLRIRKPRQQVVHRVIDDQLVKVVAVKRTKLGLFQQIRDGFINQLIERAIDRLQGGAVACDPQVQASLLGLQESSQCPVLAVVLGPEHSAILHLG